MNSTLFKEFLREYPTTIRTQHAFFYYTEITQHENLFADTFAHSDDAFFIFHRANVCDDNEYVDTIFHPSTLGTDHVI